VVLLGHRGSPEQALAALLRVAERIVADRLTLRRGDSFALDAREALDVEEIAAPWDPREIALRLSPRPAGPRR
jgi:hypothetical protein